MDGQPLPPEELKAAAKYIREHGVLQFINTWKRLKDLSNDELKFGDEIECGIFAVDHANKTVKLSIRGAEVYLMLRYFLIMQRLKYYYYLLKIKNELVEREKTHLHEAEGCSWHPEFGAWMVESTPSRPYTGYAADLLRIERNMVIRRRRMLSALREDEIAPTVRVC